MLLQKTYYTLKPYIPRRTRVAIRQIRARYLRWKHESEWPILPLSGRKPDGWPGWPDGKQFALVLTHDVESLSGVCKAQRLADLETQRGFRSSFNFVPEAYATPPELRQKLQRDGFEIGVHGLKHDGKLYNSREIFRARAKRINEYLKEWGAVGFRSPFMQHNLEWIHDLEILYDASTFDTDPFEIQNDGAATIWPFWVPSGVPGQGYIELPYTLVQDLTLFTILGETTIDIWKKKLDWIAEQGGMVMLNLHPDYLHFNDSTTEEGEYAPELYSELLSYIQTKYAGQYWNALPREVATYCKEFKPAKPRVTGRKICMLAYSHVESDNRILRYANSLTENGDQVDVLSLNDTKQRPKKEVYSGLYLERLQVRDHNEKSKLDFLCRVLRFAARAALALTRNTLRCRYDLIHVHNVPDFLVFSAIVPRLSGTRIILDIHDIVPEFYGSKFGSGGSWIVELLKIVEGLSADFAHHVIISNHLWYDKITDRSVSEERCSVHINYIDLNLFQKRERVRSGGPFRVIFPGGLQWHQGLDLAIHAFAKMQKSLPNSEFHIYGQGDQLPSLVELVSQLGLSNSVKFYGPVTVHQIPDLIANSDLGVVPKRANSFGNEAYSTKIMEFMSQGLPVVVSRTRIDTFYFGRNDVLFFDSEDVDQLAQAMSLLAQSSEERVRLSKAGLEYVQRNNWNVKKLDYLNLVDSLILNRSWREAKGFPSLPARQNGLETPEGRQS